MRNEEQKQLRAENENRFLFSLIAKENHVLVDSTLFVSTLLIPIRCNDLSSCVVCDKISDRQARGDI